MAALNLASVMADLATAVDTAITGTAHGYPVESLVSGDAVVGYPEGEQPLTATFRRGLDRVSVPVFLIAGLPQDVGTRALISSWLDDSSSVVTAIEGYASSYWSSARVTGYSIDRFDPVGGNPMVVLKLTVDVLN